jgi:hypothetical protein
MQSSTKQNVSLNRYKKKRYNNKTEEKIKKIFLYDIFSCVFPYWEKKKRNFLAIFFSSE